MDVPYDEIFACVRQSIEPQQAFRQLCDVGRSHLKSPLWDVVPTPNAEADVASAVKWLQKNISTYRPTGVYLGMDTANENNGRGKNIELGLTDVAGPLPLDIEWIYDGLDYGDDHLIRGLYEIHQAYEALGLKESESLLLDYVFYLGYSGVVLAAAVEIMQVRWDSLFVWGLHDGDMALLVKCSTSGVERLARQPGA